MREQLTITYHAMVRYRERIQDGISNAAAEKEIADCLAAAKDKHFEARRLEKRLYFIPSERCVLICSRYRIVDVIVRKQKAEAA